MVYNNPVLTNNGASLLAQSQVGESPITFTRIATGDGVHATKTTDALKTCTALTSQKQSFPISSKKYYTDTQVKLTTVLTNVNLVTGYYMNEIGLFAQLGDDSSTEVLYSIAVATVDNSDFFKPFNGSSPIEVIQSFIVTVSNSSTVEVTMGSDAFALATEMKSALDELEILRGITYEYDKDQINVVDRSITLNGNQMGSGDNWVDVLSIEGPGAFLAANTYLYLYNNGNYSQNNWYLDIRLLADEEVIDLGRYSPSSTSNYHSTYYYGIMSFARTNTPGIEQYDVNFSYYSPISKTVKSRNLSDNATGINTFRPIVFKDNFKIQVSMTGLTRNSNNYITLNSCYVKLFENQG